MRASILVACLGFSLSTTFANSASAMEPQVIGGVYGQDPATSYAQPLRPMPRPRVNYGGGLLEALLGPGRDEALPPSAPQPYFGARQQTYAPNSYAVQPQKAPDPMFQRQLVSFDGRQPPGTIVVDTANKFLYFVQGDGQALRYGIGVGRPGFLWHGTKAITRKAEWPDWTPPNEMLLRRPDLPRHMEGGMANPLGARAMYLGSSLFRIHGTNEPDTIGTNVSSGCIRLTNEDVSDLYSRVKVGTHVVVM